MKHEPYPLTQQQSKEILARHHHKIDWLNPDQIILDRTQVGDIRQTATVKEVICVAYNLKPNE